MTGSSPAIVRSSRRSASEAAPALCAAALSLGLALAVLRIWNADLHAPFSSATDIGSVLSYIQTTLRDGWPLHNPYLGAPFGQDLYDYPLGDPLQVVLTKAIGMFSSEPALVANVFFLLTFPLTALTALWALSRLGISIWTAVACAVLYALAPFHFFRGVDHLMIAAYYVVPLAGFLVLRQFMGAPPRLPLAVGLALVVGLGFPYYAVFT